MKTNRSVLALFLISILAVTACTATTGTSDESLPAIQIGLITDLTGPFVTFGKDIQTATNLAVEKINADGGVNGSLLEITLFDSGGKPDQAAVGIRELIDKGVFAISGPLSSGESEVVFAQAAQLKVPIMTGTANKEGIIDLGEGWAFRNTATNTALYTEAIPVWMEEYGIKTAVLVFDEEEPVTSAAAKFSIPGVASKVNLQIVNVDSPITFARGQTDFSATVQRIRETEADGLIIMSVPAEAGLIAREIARQGETRPILGHSAQWANTFFTQGGSEINNWLLPSIFNFESSDDDTVAYIQVMAAADTEPPTVPEAANYYDNILMFAQIIRDTGIDGNTSPEEARVLIKDALLALADFNGVAGQITFEGNLDANKTVYIYVVLNGVAEPLR
jgi:branched-chain amino acid transport system substrate-binding protein